MIFTRRRALWLGACLAGCFLFGLGLHLLGRYLQNRQQVGPTVFVPVPGMPGGGTVGPDVLRAFIQESNGKVYDRLAQEMVEAAMASGKRYRISPVLVLGVMQAESEFNLNAVSSKGARGLMQIHPEAWEVQLRAKGIIQKSSDYHDPIRSIEAGCFVLRAYLDETKDFEKALIKYLGADYAPYREKIGRTVGSILMLGISRETEASYKLATK